MTVPSKGIEVSSMDNHAYNLLDQINVTQTISQPIHTQPKSIYTK